MFLANTALAAAITGACLCGALGAVTPLRFMQEQPTEDLARAMGHDPEAFTPTPMFTPREEEEMSQDQVNAALKIFGPEAFTLQDEPPPLDPPNTDWFLLEGHGRYRDVAANAAVKELPIRHGYYLEGRMADTWMEMRNGVPGWKVVLMVRWVEEGA